jgi:hypothetical protein
MKHTGDTDVIYGVARGRDEEGNLVGITIGMNHEQATQLYDNFQATAILQFNVVVLSSVDIEIQHEEGKETNEEA